MLSEAIELQNNAVAALIHETSVKDNVLFRAPTGSGKTYMMSDYMNRILTENSNVVFIVSALSTSGLAKQSYDKFREYSTTFTALKPYLISSEISGEEQLYIPLGYNLYVLPVDLFKEGSRLMRGGLVNFLNTIGKTLYGEQKDIYLIKDESHKATNNIDSLIDRYFDKVISFTATPKLERNQIPDVTISDAEAEAVKLIKLVEWGDEEDSLTNALNKFIEVKRQYIDLLGINPCLIIQISNKDKADDELNNIVMPALNQTDLKWMLIVDSKNKKAGTGYDTNDDIKKGKLPVLKWKDYAKRSTSNIDVIIFKLVIKEGWDIPRACMLYQVRDTQSDILDKQVIGRVRRNPRLTDFETLSDDAKDLATTAWVWGVKPKEDSQRAVKLYDKDITNNIRIKTTRLKPLTQKNSLDIKRLLEQKTEKLVHESIFKLYKEFKNTDYETKNLCNGYISTIQDWWKVAENIGEIKQKVSIYRCDYAESMELVEKEKSIPKEVSFPLESFYTDSENKAEIESWIWRKADNIDSKDNLDFAFDSNAEQQWAKKLNRLVSSDNADFSGRTGKRIIIDNEVKYLWGKNYLINSDIKFEYCLGTVHSSYPDFIMKDGYNRIHIFEVKSVNHSAAFAGINDSGEYSAKVNELKKCYAQASKLTHHYFYLPVQKDNDWYIFAYIDGESKVMNFKEFERFIKTP